MFRAALTCTLVTLLACTDKGGTTETDTTGDSNSSAPGTGTETASSTDTPTTDTPTSHSSSGEPDPTSSTSGTTVDSTTTTNTTTTDSTTADSTTTDSTTGGASGLKISVTDVEIFANCQPAIPPDPMVGSWTIVYDNSAGAAATSAELTDVTFFIAEGDPPIGQTWVADPTTSGPIDAGQILMKPTKKLSGSAFPDCDFCGAPTKLWLDFLVDGDHLFLEHNDTLKCVQ